MSEIKIIKTIPNAMTPVKEHGASLGHNIYNVYSAELAAWESANLPIGITMTGSTDNVCLTLGQLPKKANKYIEVQASYDGMETPLTINVKNYNNYLSEIKPYSNLTKIVLLKCSGGEFNLVESLDSTARGENGYGSTGTK